MSVRPFPAFRVLLARPWVLPVALTSLVARLPKGMVPLATVLLLRQSTGSYAIAGLAVAVTALGDAASAPAQGWLADRLGCGWVLIPSAAVQVAATAALLVLVHDRAPAAAVVACAGLAGIGVPPVSGSMKAAWPRLAGPAALPAAYTLESLLQQVVFLSGPLLVAVMTAAAGPAAALICAAVLVAAGTVSFTVARARAVPAGRVRHGQRAHGAWRVPAVRVLGCATMLQSLVFGALPVGIAAVTAAAGRPGLAGILLAALTAGGLAGAFGPVATGSQRRYLRLSGGLAAALLPVAALSAVPSAGSLIAIGAALAVAGLFVTPIAATSYVLIEEATAPAHHTEAFTWLSTGQAIGSAAGAALAGLLASSAGAAGPLATLPGAVILAVIAVGAGRPGPPRPGAADRAAAPTRRRGRSGRRGGGLPRRGRGSR
jgi:predicted MFS family arabinose efflux permease